jgi:hypothetical protein
LVNPVTVTGLEDAVPLKPPGLEVARYVTVSLPVYVDAVKATVAWAFPAVAVPIVGVVGFLPSLEVLPATGFM